MTIGKKSNRCQRHMMVLHNQMHNRYQLRKLARSSFSFCKDDRIGHLYRNLCCNRNQRLHRKMVHIRRHNHCCNQYQLRKMVRSNLYCVVG